MSYFPCDIPFMSDDELKENGIHIPKEKITNREKLAQMSNEELAGFICDFTECGSCEGFEMCEPYAGHGNGMRNWLESEAGEEND